MKRISVNDLVIGKKYYVECGIWKGVTTYVGAYQTGQRIKYRFTFGALDNWYNQFCIVSVKSNLKIFEKGVD